MAPHKSVGTFTQVKLATFATQAEPEKSILTVAKILRESIFTNSGTFDDTAIDRNKVSEEGGNRLVLQFPFRSEV